MLGVCVVVVALVMGVICFGVFWSRRSAKSRLKHRGYTNAVFSRKSGTVSHRRVTAGYISVSTSPQLCDHDPVCLVRLLFHQDAVTLQTVSTMAETHPYDQPTLTRPPGEVALLVPSYEPIARHQNGLGNEWFANAAVHLYEDVNSQDQSAQPFPVYGYVPTMVCWCEACMCAL